MKKALVSVTAAALLVGCTYPEDPKGHANHRLHPADREPRFFSADSGSGHLVGYDQDGNAIYGSGKHWQKGDKPMRR